MAKKDIAHLSSVDFLIGADNVYRTKDFIVKQSISVCINDDCISAILSTDTYYARTAVRDAEYEQAFAFRGAHMDGKRMRTAMYTRTYTD